MRSPGVNQPMTKGPFTMRAKLWAVSIATAAWLQTVAPGDAQSGGSRPDLARMRALASDLATSYLEIWSSGGAAALADVDVLYGPQVKFYGRVLDKRGIALEKRSFMRRWALRRYAHRPGSMRVSCNAKARTCLVQSIVDWEAVSPQRERVSRGTSDFELGIAFVGPRPTVLYESGRVLARRRS
jgi:hypothetical protein